MKTPPVPNMMDLSDISLGTWRSAFHAMLESSPDAVILVDGLGRIVATNSRACTMFGYACMEMRGMEIEELVPDARREAHRAHRTEYLGAPGVRHMGQLTGLTARRKDGTVFPVEVGLGPMKTERGVFVHTIVRDVTEQAKAENALRESEERYRSIVELSPLAIVVHSEGRVRYVNKACLELIGVERREDVIGMPQTDFVPPEYREISRKRQELAMRGVKLPVLEMKVQHPDGRTLYLEANGAPIPYEGKPASHVVIHDVTARTLAEIGLRESREQLRKLTTHLQNAREDERARIAREIHDELGQDLTALKMDLAMLEDSVRGLGAEADTEPLLRIADSMSSMLDATIRSMRRIMTDLRPAVLDSLGLFAAVEWQLDEFQQRTHISGTLNAHGDDTQLTRAQSTAVFRIFQESLTNIARHSGAQNVEVDLICDHSNLVLVVHDNGCGLADSDLGKAGSFGLLGMRERAHLLGGSVDILGEQGKGTTVTVRIPFHADAEQEDEA